MHKFICLAVLIPLMLFGVFFISCGGSSSSAKLATVRVSVSDPTTCAAPQGSFSHIYVTVSDVLIHQSSTASDSDPGWVDLTPNLKSNPVQVDLLGPANQCFLAQLGSTGIPPGIYQQIRILLGGGSVTVNNNRCGSAMNCVMLASDPTSTPQPLQLSSESKTGIKIPPGQIAGGQFVIAAGESKDLNVDLNACRSIVAQGNGQYRMKPVLHAGEVALQPSVSGTIVDSATSQPIAGGTTIIALEQNDGSGLDRVVMETLADSNGAFSFCPLPAGTYDVVATAVNGSGIAYAATAITGVQPGNALGNIPLTAVSAPGSITGAITSSTGSAGTSADLSVSALLPITVNSSTLLVTIPSAAQSLSTATLSTAAGAGCPANTDCTDYTLAVPAANPAVGAFMSGANQSPAPPVAGSANYTIDAVAFVPGSAGELDCSLSELQTTQTGTNTPLTVTSGASVTASTLAFTGCK